MRIPLIKVTDDQDTRTVAEANPRTLVQGPSIERRGLGPYIKYEDPYDEGCVLYLEAHWHVTGNALYVECVVSPSVSVGKQKVFNSYASQRSIYRTCAELLNQAYSHLNGTAGCIIDASDADGHYDHGDKEKSPDEELVPVSELLIGDRVDRTSSPPECVFDHEYDNTEYAIVASIEYDGPGGIKNARVIVDYEDGGRTAYRPGTRLIRRKRLA